MKKIFYFYLLVFSNLLVFSQSTINLYDFAIVPQSQLLNPAYDIEAQYHVTIPFIGSNQIFAGSTGVTAYDILGKNKILFQDKVKNIVNQLTKKDFVLANQKMEIFNIGQRIDKSTYISYGMYEEADAYSTFPTEILKLPFDGINEMEKEYKIGKFKTEGSLLMVYHLGMQKKIDKQIQVGGRLKLYNSAISISTSSMDGTFQTNIGNNVLAHRFNEINIEIKTSGLPLKLDEDDKPIKITYLNRNGDSKIAYLLDTKDKDSLLTPGYIINNSFIGGGKGAGIDLGFVYKIDNKTTVSGSINDLGFIYNKQLAKNYIFKGSYDIDDIALEYDPADPYIYSERIKEEFFDNVPFTNNRKGYYSFRPFKINLFASYAFGGVRNNQCQTLKSAYSYKPIDKIGAHIYAQNRPNNLIYEASIFYERKITNGLLTRFNYTINKYSASNLGVAVSGQLGKLNLYAGFNNILALTNLAKAKNISAQFGINIILPRKH